MRTVAISAVLLGVAHVSVAAAAMPAVAMDDGQGATLARAGASSFLEVPDTRQSALLPVGEGGEGGRGRWRRGPPRGRRRAIITTLRRHRVTTARRRRSITRRRRAPTTLRRRPCITRRSRGSA